MSLKKTFLAKNFSGSNAKQHFIKFLQNLKFEIITC